MSRFSSRLPAARHAFKKACWVASSASALSPNTLKDRKSTRLNSSHGYISDAVFCLKKTNIDDCTRLRVLKIYDRLDQKTAIKFVDYMLEKLPFQVETIQTDNGSEFQAAFHWHLLDRGIRHVYIKPSTPRLNGNVERSHRIDDDEFYRMLAGVVI